MIFKAPTKQEVNEKLKDNIFHPLIPLIKYLLDNDKEFRYTKGHRNDARLYMNQIGSIECRHNITEFRGTKNGEHFYINYKNLVNILGKKYETL